MTRLSLIFVAALALRVVGLGSLPHNFDEPYNIDIIDSINRQEPQLPRYGFQHPPLSVYVQRAGVALFGNNNVGYRIMSALIGAFSVLLIYDLTRQGFGASAGLLAALFLATNRFHVGWSRHVDQEVLYLTLVLLSLTLFWRVYESGKGWTALAVAGVLALFAKELAVLLLPATFIFLVSTARGRKLLRRPALYGVLAAMVVAGGAIFLYAFNNPAPMETNLSTNLQRFSSLGLTARPLLFFVRSSITRDAMLPRAWMYPFMFWVTGLLLLVGVLFSIGAWRRDYVRWMITIFGFYFFFFAVVDGSLGPSLPRAGEFWWGDVALIPAIVLTSGLERCFRFGHGSGTLGCGWLEATSS